MRCKCDACHAEATAPYCAFCDASCFPVATLGGRATRTAKSRTSRVALHAGKGAEPRASNDPPRAQPRPPSPPDPYGLRAAAEHISKQAASAAAEALAPIAQKFANDALAEMRRRMGGR